MILKRMILKCEIKGAFSMLRTIDFCPSKIFQCILPILKSRILPSVKNLKFSLVLKPTC